MKVKIGKETVTLNPADAIGKGGEADVFLHKHRAVKIYKEPSHPDYVGLPNEQAGAKRRIDEHQKKLPAFPKTLPPEVIQPIELVYDMKGRIIGYAMKFISQSEVLLSYSDKTFRGQGVGKDQVLQVFRSLHKTVQSIHKSKVVIGDFNDLNVLVTPKNEALLVDADSMQYGGFMCMLYTEKFVDPRLCDANAKRPMLMKAHDHDSDWFAFALMLFQCMLFVSPYGGIYRPKDDSRKIALTQRNLKRITVFDQDVIYPRPANPLKTLPDQALHYFEEIFAKDKRGEFPIALIDVLETGKPAQIIGPTVMKQVTQVFGKVTVTQIFKTTGVVVRASYQQNDIAYVYHEGDSFKRERGLVISAGRLDPHVKWRVSGKTTVTARSKEMGVAAGAIFRPDGKIDMFSCDAYGNLPSFDTNSKRLYWISAGELYAEDRVLLPGMPPDRRHIGSVVKGQTLFWVGEDFGFGFYRAGDFTMRFVFDAEKGCLNDSVPEPKIIGKLVDATAYFSKDRCWLFLTLKQGKRIVNQCHVIRKNGNLDASAEAESGDDSWLGTIRGKCAMGHFLFCPTEDGVVRVEAQGSGIGVTQSFPDTQPFVDSGSELHPSSNGITVVSPQQIVTLKIG